MGMKWTKTIVERHSHDC